MLSRTASTRAKPLPTFDHRAAGCQSVIYTNDHEEANELVRDLRMNRRLACDVQNTVDYHGGRKEQIYSPPNMSGFADADNVILLHLSAMKQLPTELPGLLTNPVVTLESWSNLHRLVTQPPGPLHDLSMHPYLDLEDVALNLFPAIYSEPAFSAASSEVGLFEKLIAHLLGKSFSGQVANAYEWNAQKLGQRSPALRYAADSVWATKQVADALRDQLYQQAEEMEAEVGFEQAKQWTDDFLDACRRRAT